MKSKIINLYLLTLILLFNASCIGEGELIFIGILVVFFIIIGIVVLVIKGKEEAAKIKELGSEKSYPFGKYLYGLKENQPKDLIQCAETDADFVFIEGSTELGSIPVSSINNILVEDKSQVTSRFTATRIATLGIFALAAKKKKTTPSYYLTIEWKTGNLTNNAIFEFASLEVANNANNNLRQKIDKVLEKIPAKPSPLVSSEDDIPKQIEKLAEMKDKGIITEDEFSKKKKELLDKM